ncbi:hypothetical protein BZG36_02098 [Bifiguratus adelaidae]|uniref:Mitochondrial import inner membrane translocase subunit TIM54 n=1 Tax=Bifiguratus adelaidae TaxID=1938954 RepID=A0A261Y361_9FUNG|nr:hypothetical protein BZG36_02098 [Bifiguratus adelaidae]
MAEVKSIVEQAIDNNKIAVFSKSYCPRAKETLTQLGEKFFALELDVDENGNDIQAYLLQKTGQRTVPNIFINIHASDTVSEDQRGARFEKHTLPLLLPKIDTSMPHSDNKGSRYPPILPISTPPLPSLQSKLPSPENKLSPIPTTDSQTAELVDFIQEKRKRNAGASARFRDRRKQREKEMTERCTRLTSENAALTNEVKRLRAELAQQDEVLHKHRVDFLKFHHQYHNDGSSSSVLEDLLSLSLPRKRARHGEAVRPDPLPSPTASPPVGSEPTSNLSTAQHIKESQVRASDDTRPWHSDDDTRQDREHEKSVTERLRDLENRIAQLSADRTTAGEKMHMLEIEYQPKEATIVYISDVGAAHKVLFVPVACVTGAFFILTLLAERYLRHIRRLPGNMRPRQRHSAIVATVFGIIAGIALILLSIFDAFNYSTVHWIMTLLFVVCLTISAISQAVEVYTLSEDYPRVKHLKRNSMLKITFVCIALPLAIAFLGLFLAGGILGRGGIESKSNPTYNRLESAAAVCEWVIAYLFAFPYLFSMISDLQPAVKTSVFWIRRKINAERAKGNLPISDASQMENGYGNTGLGANGPNAYGMSQILPRHEVEHGMNNEYAETSHAPTNYPQANNNVNGQHPSSQPLRHVDTLTRDEMLPENVRYMEGRGLVLDVCTGSGCIALAVAHALDQAHVNAVDISWDAIKLAETNYKRIVADNEHMQGRCKFVLCDIMDNESIKTMLGIDIHDSNGKSCGYDVIVSNPPYITPRDYAQLDKSVVAWEDVRALRTSDEAGIEFHVRLLQLCTLGAIGGLVYRDKVYCSEARQRLADKVRHIAAEPLAVSDMPRKVTVYITAPPGDTIEKSRIWFRDYVKPVFVAAALDYEVKEAREPEQLRSMVCEEIRQRRKKAESTLNEEGGKPQHSTDPLAKFLTPQQDAKALNGIVTIGRVAWREMLNGLNEGCHVTLADPVKPDTSDATEGEEGDAAPGNHSEITGEPATAGDAAKIPQQSLASKDQTLLQNNSVSASADGTNPSSQDEVPYFSLPPAFAPVSYVPQYNLIGWANIPKRIWLWINDYERVAEIGEYAVTIALEHTRPFREDDLHTGEDERYCWNMEEGKKELPKDEIKLDALVMEQLTVYTPATS